MASAGSSKRRAASQRVEGAARTAPPKRAGPARRGPGHSRPQTSRAGTRPGAPSAHGATGSPPGRGGAPQVWRLAALSLVLVLLGVFLFPTVSGFVEQRREVSRLERQIEAQRADIAELEKQKREWNNPDVIERRARERLRFVRPGEVAFTVVDDTGEMLTEPVPGMTAVTNDVHESRPWYGEMWESIRTANEGLPETAPDAP
ncbi:MAG TPA: septum formation initiator family protein [Ornithinimicrobium sp.]|nr:septum formation initiator family protein [Ornithinimicrobium sp.]